MPFTLLPNHHHQYSLNHYSVFVIQPQLTHPLTARKMDKRTSTMFVATLLCFLVMAGGDDSLAGKCASQFDKVAQCLTFVTGKAAAPSKDCCDSVTDLKEDNPACLCYIIQQIHNGSNAAVKSMGVQEARLLQLPSACKLVNASVTECPKLLNLPANSPDAAIFTNATTPAASTTTGPGASSATTAPSDGYWHKPQLTGYLLVVVSIFFHAFSSSGLIPLKYCFE